MTSVRGILYVLSCVLLNAVCGFDGTGKFHPIKRLLVPKVGQQIIRQRLALWWGDDERAEVETFVAIAIEVMKRTNVSKLRECARIVELRYLSHDLPK